jgi:hypothetical protein
MKNNVSNKMKLAIGLTMCAMLLATILPNVIGSPPERPVKDFDWNDWQNKPHMFSIPPGNVGTYTWPW